MIVFPLLAQSEPSGWRDVVMILGPVVAAAGTWLLSEWRKGRTQTRANRIADEATAIGYYERIIDRMNKDKEEREKEHREQMERTESGHAECLGRLEAISARVTQAEVKYARMEVYVESLEERLEEKGIRFRRWRDTPNSEAPGAEPPPEPKRDSSHNLKPPQGGQS